MCSYRAVTSETLGLRRMRCSMDQKTCCSRWMYQQVDPQHIIALLLWYQCKFPTPESQIHLTQECLAKKTVTWGR